MGPPCATGSFSGARMAGSTRLVGWIYRFFTFMKVYESRYMIHHSDQCWSLRPHKKFGAIRCSDAMLSTTLQCTSRIWRAMCGSSMVIDLYTYQLMLSVLNLTSLICWFFQYTPHVWCFFWWLNRQRWLKWLTTWPAMVFLGPPAEKIETAGDPREFVEPELWRIQRLLFIVSPTIWIPLGA